MFEFKEYDYKNGKSAEVRSKDEGYSLGIKNDHLVWRKKTDLLSPTPDKGINSRY